MANTSFNKIIGNFGEDQACNYLKKNKFKIKNRNYKCNLGEIDIIAFKDNIFHFIEVKNRSNNLIVGRYAVNNNKQKHIKNVANYYIIKNKLGFNYFYSFDVIEITDSKIEFIENCFY